MDNTVYDVPLDEEEQEILDLIDREDWEPVPVPDSAEKIEQLRQSARAFLEEKKREYPVLITRDELIEAREILGAQWHGGGYLPHTAQTIKSLLDKIEAAIANHSLASQTKKY